MEGAGVATFPNREGIVTKDTGVRTEMVAEGIPILLTHGEVAEEGQGCTLQPWGVSA